MAFHMEHCDNAICCQPYLVEEFDSSFSGMQDCGQVVCPHCGASKSADSNTVYVTAPLALVDKKQHLTAA
jgi:uncharacterized protein (UPF0212 family)